MKYFSQMTFYILLLPFSADAFQTDTTTRMATEDKKIETAHPVASSEFNLMDKDQDGTVTEKEASEIGVNNLFSDMDINGDGILSRREYMTYRQQDTPQIKKNR